MAGRKYGAVIFAQTPASYHALSAAEKAKPGKAIEQVLKKYAGRVELVRRYWTSAFSADVSDVHVFECDDPADMHAFQEEIEAAMARASGGDPDRYGTTVHQTFGINPDAEAPRQSRGRSRR
jgi:hypothetical protein